MCHTLQPCSLLEEVRRRYRQGYSDQECQARLDTRNLRPIVMQDQLQRPPCHWVTPWALDPTTERSVRRPIAPHVCTPILERGPQLRNLRAGANSILLGLFRLWFQLDHRVQATLRRATYTLLAVATRSCRPLDLRFLHLGPFHQSPCSLTSLRSLVRAI